MNQSGVRRLTDLQEKGLSACLIKIAEWEKFRNDYEALKDRLNTLADHITYDVTVPFGSLAFMQGHLIHTNEVTVYLGDGWFAEVSSKQAVDIANRRIKQCDEMLKKLYLEKINFENWLKYIPEVAQQDLVEIIEEYDEEKEKLWREQHVKNIRNYVKSKSISGDTTERTLNIHNIPDESDHMTDKACMQLLENLAIAEEYSAASEENELCDPESENSSDAGSSEDFSMDSDDNTEEEKETGFEFSEDENKHVKWLDQVVPSANKITFTHSSSKSYSISQCSSQEKICSFPLSAVPSPVILSPSDICKRFGHVTEPKSILKKNHTIHEPKEPGLLDNYLNESTDDIRETKSQRKKEKLITSPTQIAFSGEIVECAYEKLDPETSFRPISRFKAARQKKCI